LRRYIGLGSIIVILGVVLALGTASSDTSGQDGTNFSAYRKRENIMAETKSGKTDQAVLAGGCFWCVEAVYESIEGVTAVVSGYTGGGIPNPSYGQVSAGTTGHAEAVRIEYDPDVISYGEILSIFWRSHDPTTVDRQGADFGSQYRSAIYYITDEQREIAERSLIDTQTDFEEKIVTEIARLGEFYIAEDYHQDYFRLNPAAGYCQIVIAPKLQKLGLIDQTY
jgi:peptide-methionine (S)-S-oxide reductase